MKKQLLTSAIAGCFLAASGAAAASDHAGALEALTGVDINGTKLTKDLGIDFGGWVSAGFAWNTGDPSDNRNGPVTFNDRDLEFQMNQLNLFISEEATAGDNFDLGFRADVMFGTDTTYTQATGLDDKLIPADFSSRYDLAIPQVYAELYAPIGNGVTIKAGHFYTIIGNEVVTSPDNFFYSHAYTMQYGEPFTHTGFLAETALTDSINIRAGSVLGWDAFNDNTDQAWSFIGGADWTSADGATSVTLASVYGDTTEDSGLTRFIYSVVATHDITDSLHLLIQHDHGVQETTGDDNEWYGVNSYLTYDVSDNLGVAVRGEWFRDDDNARGLNGATGADSYYAITGGINYSITNWLKVRPEVRYDWSDNTNAFDASTKDDQFLVSTDVVITF
jgi:hypothetical protein